MHPDDQVPRPVSPVIERPSLLHSVVTVVGMLVMAAIAVVLYRLATEPIFVTGSTTASQTVPSSVIASPPVIPPELVQMAVAISTALAPTATPTIDPTPTATYVMLPTPTGPDICLTSTPKGETCAQPMPPLPTSTPVMPCPVAPGSVCISQGKPVAWLTPTATPMPLTTSGQSN